MTSSPCQHPQRYRIAYCDSARSCSQTSGNYVHCSSLPGSVRSQKAIDLAALNGKCQIGNCGVIPYTFVRFLLLSISLIPRKIVGEPNLKIPYHYTKNIAINYEQIMNTPFIRHCFARDFPGYGTINMH